MPQPDSVHFGRSDFFPSLPPDLKQLVQQLVHQGVSWSDISDAVQSAFNDRIPDAPDQQSLLDYIRELPQSSRQDLQNAAVPPGQFKDLVDRALQANPGQSADGPQAAASHGNSAAIGHADGGRTATPSAISQTANAFGAQQASPQAAALSGQQVAQAQQVDRGPTPLQLPQGGRSGDAIAAGRPQETGAAITASPDRVSAAQQQLLAQAVPMAQGRTAVMAATVMAQIPGATVLANPQGTVMPAQVTPPAPPGTENAAAQARDGLLAPAGHTLAGSLRRDLRRGVQPPHERRADWLLALLPGRGKRTRTDEEETPSFQWLFWVLTVAAYGALAIAVIAMIPSGGGLTDGFGRPSYGAYALIFGAIAAVASWFVGRRLSRR